MIIMDITLESGLRRFAVGLTQDDLEELLQKPLDATVITDLEPGVELHIFSGRDDEQLQTYVASQFSYANKEHKA